MDYEIFNILYYPFNYTGYVNEFVEKYFKGIDINNRHICKKIIQNENISSLIKRINDKDNKLIKYSLPIIVSAKHFDVELDMSSYIKEYFSNTMNKDRNFKVSDTFMKLMYYYIGENL